MDGITDSIDMGLGGLWELMMDREAWRVAIHGVAKSRTRLNDCTELGDFHFHFQALAGDLYRQKEWQVSLFSGCFFVQAAFSARGCILP